MNAIHDAFAQAEDFERGKGKVVVGNSQTNVRLALNKMGVTLSHDIFADRLLYTKGDTLPRLLDDAAIESLWLAIDAQFHFRPSMFFFQTVLRDKARQNWFHPVRNYLDPLKWDGKPRIDSWLIEYGGAEDSDYVRAVGAIVLVAAVKRIRTPGAKFDEMLVLEGPQGVAQKSSGLAALSPNPTWFSDDLPLNSDSKQVIERTSGKWLIEAGELSGMYRKEIEHLKAFLSRSVDSARLSYDKVTTERARHFVVIGTTNSDNYLKDSTGNRRFWPVRVSGFDIDALKHNRDQIWAEAAAREAGGATIRLDRKLWPVAAEKQEERRVFDPWEEIIATQVGDANGKILSETVWAIVGLIDPARRTQDHNSRLGAVMARLGFERGRARHEGLSRYHYMRGTKAEREIAIQLIL